MKHFFIRNALGLGIATTIAFAQVAAPPAPVAPTAPRAVPAPPSPGEFNLSVPDLDFDLDIRMEVDRAVIELDVERMAEEASKILEAGLHTKFMEPRLLAQRMATPRPMPTPKVWALESRRAGGADRYYSRGTYYLDRREWQKAIDAFDHVIQGQGTRADGAHYWKAYAQHRLGRRNDALTTLAELNKSFAQSRWVGDAKVLEAEVRAASGQPVSPEAEADEDLKLYAINSLVHSDPERAVPLLDRILSKNNPPKLKERALFVLAQSRTPKASEIVAGFARGKGNPDLQAKAVEYLGVYGGKENLQTLSEIYSSNNDYAVRRAVLRSYMVSKDKDRLMTAARSETNADLRRQAIDYLGAMRATSELADLYKAEPAAEVRQRILQALSESENAERVIEIARSEKDPKLRAYAVRRLGDMNRTRTADALAAMYGSETDKAVKTEIISALEDQHSARELVQVAKSEKNPELKRFAVRKLSQMKSKEATDFLMELIDK